MTKYHKINNLLGWVVFIVAATVYILTLEPTVSFWDCGEFISASYKLEVGHPPGAPFFMLIGRFFTLFTSNPQHVAVAVNVMSALASAFTILFLFWTITHLSRKFFNVDKHQYSLSQYIAIMGSGVVGALAYTFSDTFWFSAVEGEVYALSSLFTAVVFWAILKWEDEAHKPFANRWIILIAYLMGLSIGVHLLNLLAIPAIVMLYYFKKHKPTIKGVLIALGVSVLLLGTVMYAIISGVVVIASKFELLFVNGLGLPYNSGLFFYIFLLFGSIAFGIYLTHKKKSVLWNNVLIAFGMIMIGYSTYTVIMVRSSANPPMDQNDPSNAFTLLYYLNREQYGDRPLVYGQYYNAQAIESKQGKPLYRPVNGKYEITSYKPEYIYDKRFTTFFPRMHSGEPNHIEAYKQWGDIKGRKIRVEGMDEVQTIPTFGENIKFFINYQVGWMYFRYFMWNFSGRQNDIQGHGNSIHGNWMSGVKWIDEFRLGSQEDIPQYLLANKGRNNYYMLPLILGILGLVYQMKKRKKDFVVVTLLFLLTGFAILVYLNQSPFQPRERDYAYAGSFYAFAIWIGLGVFALAQLLSAKINKTAAAVVAVWLTFLAVPVLMANQNWDDHDRSGRYTARDFAKNYLNTCAPNSILFTNGDNDTFPLWYAQEVEGVRTDVRVVNLSYIGADWYIDQLKRAAYTSQPLPISLTKEQYQQGVRDVVYVNDRVNRPLELTEAITFVASDDARTRIQSQGTSYDYIPSKQLKITVDAAKVIAQNVLSPSHTPLMVKEINWSLNKNYVIKNELIILDLLAHSQWKRPIYYAVTVSNDNCLGLDSFLRMDGFAYRFVPVNFGENEFGETGKVDADIMYDNMMNKYVWGNMNDTNIYINEDNVRMMMNYRNLFVRLAKQLIDDDKKDSARLVLERCKELIPEKIVPFSFFSVGIADCYYQIGDTVQGDNILTLVNQKSIGDIVYYLEQKPTRKVGLNYEKRLALFMLQQTATVSAQHQRGALSKKMEEDFYSYYAILKDNIN